MNVNEFDELKSLLIKTTEDFIVKVSSEYDIPLTLSRESLPLFEKVIDKVKKSSGIKCDAVKNELSAFLTVLFLKYFEGELFNTEFGYGVRLFNTSIGQNIQIFPDAWIAKRIQNPKESIAFKFAVLSAKKGAVNRLSSEWPEDKPLAANFAKRLGVSSHDESFINNFIQGLLEHPEKTSNELVDYPDIFLDKIKQNEKSYKYFLGRIYKVHFFVAKLKFKYDYRKFGRTFELFSIRQVLLTSEEYLALLEYIKDVPFGVYDNIFEQVFDMEKSAQLFKKGNPELRDEAIIHLLELNGRKIYHHNIKELKKILGFIREDNAKAINYLLSYRVEYRQGCYKVIEYIFSYKFNGKGLYDNFVCQKDIIIWLDNASGKEPKKAWSDKLEAIEHRGISQDINIICKWMLAHDELKYDEENNWLDTVFNHFQKSAKWYVGRDI
jgi:hypothetical protein